MNNSTHTPYADLTVKNLTVLGELSQPVVNVADPISLPLNCIVYTRTTNQSISPAATKIVFESQTIRTQNIPQIAHGSGNITNVSATPITIALNFSQYMQSGAQTYTLGMIHSAYAFPITAIYNPLNDTTPFGLSATTTLMPNEYVYITCRLVTGSSQNMTGGSIQCQITQLS